MYVKLRRNDDPENSFVVQMGGEVLIHSLPDGIPLSVVDTCHPVTLRGVRTDSSGIQHATVSYNASTQRVLELPTSHLRAARTHHAAATKFNIGDHVKVSSTANTLFAPVGSEGTVLGGGGRDGVCTASFIVRIPGNPPVTVTQDFVPNACLTFLKEGEEDKGEDDEGEEEDENEGEDDEGEEEDENGEEEDDEKEEEDKGEEEEDEKEGEEDDEKEEEDKGEEEEEEEEKVKAPLGSGLMVLQRELESEVYEELIQLLELDELDVLAARIGASPPTDVDGALKLLDDE